MSRRAGGRASENDRHINADRFYAMFSHRKMLIEVYTLTSGRKIRGNSAFKRVFGTRKRAELLREIHDFSDVALRIFKILFFTMIE